jgi:hypothetical protein
VSLRRNLDSLTLVQLVALSREQWEKRSREVDDLHAQMSWAYQFIADHLGLTLDPDDRALPIVFLAMDDSTENEIVRTLYGVGQNHPEPNSQKATLLDVMKVLALCFELSMRAEDALQEVMRVQAMMSLKEQQG